MRAYRKGIPNKISCSILVSPAGLQLGSKLKMIKDVLIPLVLFNVKSSEKHLNKIVNNMSEHTMKEIDKQIIGDIFKYTKLEQEMPKLTEQSELINYKSPTLIIAGKKDIFFPESRVNKVANEIIPNLTAFKTLDMGHIPSDENIIHINNEIKDFLKAHY